MTPSPTPSATAAATLAAADKYVALDPGQFAAVTVLGVLLLVFVVATFAAQLRRP